MMKYYLQIFIEEAETIYYKSDENGIINYNDTTKSLAGHMWFRIFIEDKGNNIISESIVDAGYTSNGIVNNDAKSYAGEPKCQSQKLPITKEAYEKLREFAQRSNSDKKKGKIQENPYAKSLGFGNTDYNFVSNSCIDYAWKALEIAGYNQEQFEGKLVPMFNCQKVQTIAPKSIIFTIQPLILNRDDLFTLFDTRFNSDTLLFNFNILQNTAIQPQPSTQTSPTDSTTKAPQQTKESTASKTLTPNNNNSNSLNISN